MNKVFIIIIILYINLYNGHNIRGSYFPVPYNCGCNSTTVISKSGINVTITNNCTFYRI